MKRQQFVYCPAMVRDPRRHGGGRLLCMGQTQTNPLPPEQWDLTFAGVYRITPDLGTLSLLIDDFVVPNGLAFSPDERVLYISDSRRHHIRAFDLLPSGTLGQQTDRVFADLRGKEPGVPDGMKVDTEGNVYCGGAGGILDHGSARYKAGPHRPWGSCHHQSRLRR